MQVQVPANVKKLVQRCGHGAAAVTVNSDCVEVIVIGGWKGESIIADPVVLTFGKCIRVLGMEVIRITGLHILLIQWFLHLVSVLEYCVWK